MTNDKLEKGVRSRELESRRRLRPKGKTCGKRRTDLAAAQNRIGVKREAAFPILAPDSWLLIHH
jgi:hypothetical protein